MSVYTPLEFDEVAAFLARYDGLRLQRLQATTTGIENSNFFLDTTDATGQTIALVLTVFESVPEQELPYFSALLEHLQDKGLPVPAPLHDRNGVALQRIRNKPCMLVPRLRGGHIHTPSVAQCEAIATALARIHVSGFSQPRRSDFDAQWRERSFALVSPQLPVEDRQLLRNQLDRWHHQDTLGSPLPTGVTHGDLFHDNALFDGDALTGIIDFYYACDDVLIYDLAILINDWCNDENGDLDSARYEAVLRGYQTLRLLSPAEHQALPDFLVYAALRFWLSRLVNACDPGKVGVQQKSPEGMRGLVLRRLVL
jgi:homoserine kinase type II